MTSAWSIMTALWRDESGISSVEYALLLGFIGAGILGAASVLSNAIENRMLDTANCLSDSDC